MSAFEKLGGIKTIIGATFGVKDAIKQVIGEFPNLSNAIYGVSDAAKDGTKGFELLKTAGKGLGCVISAHPFNSAVVGITALIAAVKIADAIIDKANDSTEELLEKKDGITNFPERHFSVSFSFWQEQKDLVSTALSRKVCKFFNKLYK